MKGKTCPNFQDGRWHQTQRTFQTTPHTENHSHEFQRIWMTIGTLQTKVNDCTKIIELLKKEREDNRELYHLRIKDLEEERVLSHRLKDDISTKNAEINDLKSRIIQLERLVRERNSEIEQLCSNQQWERPKKPAKSPYQPAVPHITSVKYCGGCSVHRGDNISTVGDSFSTEEVVQYRGG